MRLTSHSAPCVDPQPMPPPCQSQSATPPITTTTSARPHTGRHHRPARLTCSSLSSAGAALSPRSGLKDTSRSRIASQPCRASASAPRAKGSIPTCRSLSTCSRVVRAAGACAGTRVVGGGWGGVNGVGGVGCARTRAGRSRSALQITTSSTYWPLPRPTYLEGPVAWQRLREDNDAVAPELQAGRAGDCRCWG